ncbi:hypothetical protein [Streptomyces xanthophaeus]
MSTVGRNVLRGTVGGPRIRRPARLPGAVPPPGTGTAALCVLAPARTWHSLSSVP